jgi:ribonuclease BN (tRNA processing enzyme)
MVGHCRSFAACRGVKFSAARTLLLIHFPAFLAGREQVFRQKAAVYKCPARVPSSSL